MRRLWLATFAGALGCLLAPPAANAQNLTLEALVDRAMEGNPTLDMVRERTDAARFDVLQNRLWPNMHLFYATETVNGHESHGVFLRQVLPTSGRLGTSAAVHERDAELGEVLMDEQRLRVRNSVRGLYRAALIMVPQIELAEEQVALLEESLQTIQELVNVGLEDRTDVLETEMDLRHARLEVEEKRIEQRKTWTTLAQMIGDPTLTLSPLAGDPMELPPVLDYDALLAQLLADSPQTRAAQSLIERAEAAVEFERREMRPDVDATLGVRRNLGVVGFGHDEPVLPAWELVVDLGASVPIWNRNQHGVRAALADVREEEAAADLVALSLRAKFEDTFHAYEVERAEAQVFRDELLPRAEEVHMLALGRYEDFGEDYGEVLEARGLILGTRGEILESLAAAWQKAVMLEGMLLGAGLMAPNMHLLENSALGSVDTEYR